MYNLGDSVVVNDLRRSDLFVPEDMKAYSGQIARITKIISAQMYSTPNGNETVTYYEIDRDCGRSLWPERYLTPYTEPKQDDTEYIETILKLIADIDGKIDAIKRVLWRKKHS